MDFVALVGSLELVECELGLVFVVLGGAYHRALFPFSRVQLDSVLGALVPFIHIIIVFMGGLKLVNTTLGIASLLQHHVLHAERVPLCLLLLDVVLDVCSQLVKVELVDALCVAHMEQSLVPQQLIQYFLVVAIRHLLLSHHVRDDEVCKNGEVKLLVSIDAFYTAGWWPHHKTVLAAHLVVERRVLLHGLLVFLADEV